MARRLLRKEADGYGFPQLHRGFNSAASLLTEKQKASSASFRIALALPIVPADSCLPYSLLDSLGVSVLLS
jgi:hypothetical protein